MPFPNFHAARVADPDLFVRIRVLQTLPNGIMIYGGPLKTDPRGSGKPQSYRFPKAKFTPAEAKKWLKDHDISFISFEEATGKSMKNIQFKNFQIEEFKAADDGLIIKGHGAVFNNIDSYGDVIKAGAFKKTLQDMQGRIAFCLQHDIRNPIGKILAIKEDDKGLALEVKISDAEKGIQTKVKEGILKEMSIGYQVINAENATVEGQEVKLLTEIKLFEVSLVTIAANPLALVEEMKSDEEKQNYIESEFDRIIAIERNHEKKFELLTLKALVLNMEPQQDKSTPVDDEPQMSKNEILEILTLKNNG
jgi:HK97 family phage prohead protease